MKKIFLLFILTIIFTGLCGQQLYNLKTDDLNMVYYSNAHSYIVPHLARSYQRTWNYYQNFWDYNPYESTTMFLEDFSDWANGGATAVPRNFVYISMSPYMYVFEVAPANERMSLLMHHELTHITAMDMANKQDRFFRKLFGGKIQQVNTNPLSLLYAYLTTPRKYAPRWYHEGIAVNMETWMSGGIGRAMGSYDEMVFRSLVRDNSRIYNLVGLEAEGTAIDFQVGANSYLYGTRFCSYLAWQYGPQKLIKWVSRTEGSNTYFSQRFKQVYGKKLTEAWIDWLEFEKQFQTENLERIRQNPVSKLKPITFDAMGSVSRSYYDAETKKLYSAVKYPGQLAHIAEIDVQTGNRRKICNIKGASTYYTTSLVWDQAGNRLFFTDDNYYRRDLCVVDLESGKKKLLIKNLRTGDLAWNMQDESIWGVRHENGISTLVRISAPYTDWVAIHAFAYGTDIYDLDISPDGTKLTAAITHINGNQELACFELKKLTEGDASYRQIYDFDYSSPANFVFSKDGKHLYGTSYYSGVSNVYRYDFEKDDIFILSNAETGFFRPVPVNSDSLIVFNYIGGKGWRPGWLGNRALDSVSAILYLGNKVVKKYSYVKDWNDGSPAQVDLEELQTYRGDYNFWKNIHLMGAYPIVEGYKDYVSWGYHASWQDAVGLYRLAVNASFTPQTDLPKTERMHLDSRFSHRNLSLHASYNKADFYDLFGPTKVSRKGYNVGLEYTYNLIYDKPRLMDISFNLDGYAELEVLPQFQNVYASYDKMATTSTTWSYQFMQRSLGGVTAEKGYELQAVAAASYVNQEYYPQLRVKTDLGFPLKIHHSSIWWRNSAGYHFSGEENSFANFYFGGFGNNWVDKGKIERYRSYFSFPGLEIDEVGGQSFSKTSLELNLPPFRFRQWGVPGFYARWLRPAVFGGILLNDVTEADEREFYYNVGMQIDWRFVALSLLKTTFSCGYALAWDEDLSRSEEFMISLKLF